MRAARLGISILPAAHGQCETNGKYLLATDWWKRRDEKTLLLLNQKEICNFLLQSHSTSALSSTRIIVRLHLALSFRLAVGLRRFPLLIHFKQQTKYCLAEFAKILLRSYVSKLKCMVGCIYWAVRYAIFCSKSSLKVHKIIFAIHVMEMQKL